MATIVIVGQKGTGKTALATKLVLTNPEIPSYSNYVIDSPNYRKLDFTILPTLNEQHIVVFDEAYMYLDSRRSIGSIPINLSHLLFQSRKRKSDYILTLQLDSSLDLRFRDLADVYILSELKDAIYDENDEMIDGTFSYHIVKNGNYLGQWQMSFDYAKKYIFGKYDTEQLINTSKDIGKELSLIEPESEELGIQDIINKMEDKIPLEKWDKAMIKDLVMELRYPIRYADKVYGRKKRILFERSYNNV